jgi:hypothetical protein
MKLNYFWIRICVLGALIAIASTAKAVGQQVDMPGIGLLPNLTKWSPELVGGQWGWRLTKYKSLEDVYNIDGRTIVQLSTDQSSTDNVVWDPLTGGGDHLDHEASVRFIQEHGKDIQPAIIANGPIKISGARVIVAEPSYGNIGTCSPNFAWYYSVYDSSHRLLRSFYVVEKLVHPIVTMKLTCVGGRPMTVEYKVHFEYDNELTWFADLQDGTIMFIRMDENGTTIVRLDKSVQQHTSVSGRVFILDAAPINVRLRSLDRFEDARFRYPIFLKEIEAARKSGLPEQVSAP